MAQIKERDHQHGTFVLVCDCGEEVTGHSWWSVSCPKCKAEYNGGGQRLRSDWRNNASLYDDEVGDLEGYEMAHTDW